MESLETNIYHQVINVQSASKNVLCDRMYNYGAVVVIEHPKGLKCVSSVAIYDDNASITDLNKSLTTAILEGSKLHAATIRTIIKARK